MYKRILLAYDGSVEGRTALREGALLARQCVAEVFLLSVLVDPGAFLLAEVALAGVSVGVENDFTEVTTEAARFRSRSKDGAG
jgi:nucleotide-binding universal stress UspA family protein